MCEVFESLFIRMYVFTVKSIHATLHFRCPCAEIISHRGRRSDNHDSLSLFGCHYLKVGEVDGSWR